MTSDGLDEATAPEDATPEREGSPDEWHSASEALQLVFSRQLLPRLVVIALVVGTILSMVNQAHIMAAGDLNAATWARIVANYVTPFVVASIGALSAARR